VSATWIIAGRFPGANPLAPCHCPKGDRPDHGPPAYLPAVLIKPLILVGVLVYSVLVGLLRWHGVIGDRGAYILFGVMVLDLAATHWVLQRRARHK